MDQGSAILAVGVLAFGGPFLVDRLRARTRRLERLEDFKRQDAVAAKVDDAASQAREAASLLDSQQRLLVSKTDEVAVIAQASQADTSARLQQIHTLVNSNMTAALRGELDQTKITLGVLNRLGVVTLAAGHNPTPEELAMITVTAGRIAELEAVLADRLAQTKIDETEVAAKQ